MFCRLSIIGLLVLTGSVWSVPGNPVDAVSGASRYHATEGLSQAMVLDLVQNRFFDRVLIVGTTNPDQTPNAGIFTLTTVDDVLIIYGSDAQQTIQNLKTRKTALVTLYMLPRKGELWSKHRGARIRVRLIEDPARVKTLELKKGVGEEAGSWYFLEITRISPLG